MKINRTILIVEDEEKLRTTVSDFLKLYDYNIIEAKNGEMALEQFEKNIHSIDLVLLDIMLPDMDGMTICRKVREISSIPIIMLTARDDVEDKVHGLDLGADDYITKPFAIQELLARVRNALRKYKNGESDIDINGERLQVKDMVMYPSRYEVMVQGEEVQLTKKEYALLEYMLRNKRNVLTRDQILQEVWGYDYTGDTNVVDVYIRYLRAKIDDHFHQKYIYTVRGVGYAIKE